MISYEPAKKKNAKDNKNNRWKGDNASYASKHQFLKRNFGNPMKCEFCGIEGKKEKGGRWSIHYAKKLDKKYTHSQKDYFGLCRKCHGIYDLNDIKIQRLRKQLSNLTDEQKNKLSKSKSRVAKLRKRNNGRFISIT